MNAITMGGGVAIQELSFDEMDLVDGAGDVSTAADITAGAALTAASVAARVGAPQVAAGLAVVGLVAFVVARATD